MKQCAQCDALYAPRLDECPFCDAGAPAPKAWVRTKSKTKTRQVRAVEKPAERKKKRRDSKDPTPRNMDALRRTVKIPVREDLLADASEPGREEIDPATFDKTVEMSRDFLDEHSSEILGLADNTDEAFSPRKSMGDLWTQFQDEIKTAKVQYLGEEDPDSYDLEDLVAPPPEEAVESILAGGQEEDLSDPEGFFVDFDALDQLWDTSEVEVEVPQPTHGPPQLDANAVERMKLVNQIVARSRKLVHDSVDLVREPPPAPLIPPRARYHTSQSVEPWQLEDVIVVDESPPPSMKAESPWAPRIAAVGLASVAVWAYMTAHAWPVIAALAVGAVTLLLLSRTSG